jgi:hypothetical protein
MKKATNIILTSVFTFLLYSVAISQSGTIRGTVLEKESGAPVIFSSVLIKDKAYGGTTDVNGFYQISKVPAGTYTLTIGSMEYAPIEIEVTVRAGRITSQNLFLESVLEEVEINASRIEDKTKVKISVIKATKKDIKAVPSVGGESDIATYFQTVPGVVTTGDQGGQMYVRGGSPVQNKVLLDGMIIYNPFHSIGFFSVFDTEIIRNADIYTGGYSATYGGRISSIMDITTKDGNKRKTTGRVAFNPFGAKLTLGGPLQGKKKREANDGRANITYLFSGKHSYLEQSSKLFYSNVVEGDEGLPYGFTDLYGKISMHGNNGSKFNVFGFNFRDNVTWQQLSTLKWSSYGIGTNFVVVPEGSPVLISGKFNYSEYGIGMRESFPDPTKMVLPDSSTVKGFSGGFDFKYFLEGDDEIKYGISLEGLSTEYSFFNSAGREIEQTQNTTEISAYIDYKIVRGRLVLNPSFRMQVYATSKITSPEPRLGIKYNVNENFRLKFAGGLYSQNLTSANSDRDVVNLFYGFLTGSEDLQDDLTSPDGKTKELTHSLQKATHAITGFEYDLGKNLSLNVEGYYKWFNQLTNTNRNKIYDDSPSTDPSIPDVLKKDYIVETGQAFGVDLVLKYTNNRTYIWFVYSLGKVDRWDGIQTYAPVFDRRHNINFIATYFLDKKKNWELNGRWNLGSGLPFTQTQGYYQNIDFSQGIGTNVTTDNTDQLGTLYADINKGRLPVYHRLDITLKKHIELKNKSKMEITASATNAYSRENIFFVDRITNEKVYQLPLIPSLGFSWTF